MLKVIKHGYYLPENYHGGVLGIHWVPGESDFPL